MLQWIKQLFCAHTWEEVLFFGVEVPYWKQPNTFWGERGWVCSKCDARTITSALNVPISYVG